MLRNNPAVGWVVVAASVAAAGALAGCFKPVEPSTGRLSIVTVALQVEPEAVIFASGFETGDTSEWVDAMPTVEIIEPVAGNCYGEDCP